jgi:hypothetical protein
MLITGFLRRGRSPESSVKFYLLRGVFVILSLPTTFGSRPPGFSVAVINGSVVGIFCVFLRLRYCSSHGSSFDDSISAVNVARLAFLGVLSPPADLRVSGSLGLALPSVFSALHRRRASDHDGGVAAVAV